MSRGRISSAELAQRRRGARGRADRRSCSLRVTCGRQPVEAHEPAAASARPSAARRPPRPCAASKPGSSRRWPMRSSALFVQVVRGARGRPGRRRGAARSRPRCRLHRRTPHHAVARAAPARAADARRFVSPLAAASVATATPYLRGDAREGLTLAHRVLALRDTAARAAVIALAANSSRERPSIASRCGERSRAIEVRHGCGRRSLSATTFLLRLCRPDSDS